jgi:hypothetical protein
MKEKIFNPSNLDETPVNNPFTEMPFVIIGETRSGKTLLTSLVVRDLLDSEDEYSCTRNPAPIIASEP